MQAVRARLGLGSLRFLHEHKLQPVMAGPKGRQASKVDWSSAKAWAAAESVRPAQHCEEQCEIVGEMIRVAEHYAKQLVPPRVPPSNRQRAMPPE